VETYELSSESNVAVLETYCRKGKNPTRVLSVDIDAELNAEHCVEPDNEIQLCAIAPGVRASADNRAVFVLKPVDASLRLLERFLLLALDAIVEFRSDSSDSAMSKELAL
jgi:hypothetical protein